MKSIIIISIILLMMTACTGHNYLSGAVKNKNWTLQVVQLKADADYPGGVIFKIRLALTRHIKSSLADDIDNLLWYHMDSCFYLLKAQGKTQPHLIQPVSNGIADTYEYLVDFEIEKSGPADSLHLVFNDKYIGHQKYLINLTR